MANYSSDRTGASIDQVLDNADAGNIGKKTLSTSLPESLSACGFGFSGSSAPNNPTGTGAYSVVSSSNSGVDTFHIIGSVNSGRMFFGGLSSSALQPWQELYHTGNTGVASFGGASPVGGEDAIEISSGGNGRIDLARSGVSELVALGFYNDNGQVGKVTMSGTATAYNTSSDPRLKDFAPAPTDTAINSKFDDLFSSFKVFNWKTDPQGDLVWGFSAWDIEDAGLDCASAGEGPRDLNLGDVYETIPAVTESRVVMDSDGNPTTQIEEVVVTEAIEKKVSPSGIDQGKMTSYLVPMIELQKRQIAALTARLDAAGL